VKTLDFMKRIAPACAVAVIVSSVAWGAFVYWAKNEWHSAVAGSVVEAQVTTLQESAVVLTNSIMMLQTTLDANEKRRRMDTLKATQQQLRAQKYLLDRMVAEGTARAIDRRQLYETNNALEDIEKAMDRI